MDEPTNSLGPLTAKNVPIGVYTPKQLTFPVFGLRRPEKRDQHRRGRETPKPRSFYKGNTAPLRRGQNFSDPQGRASASALPGELNRASLAPLGPREPQEEPQKRRSLGGATTTAITLLAVNCAGAGIGWGHGAVVARR